PLRIHLVGWLVIMLRPVFILLLLSKSRRLADDVAACASVERWKTHLRKLEIIGAIKSAFLRLAVRVHDAALRRGRSREHVVEIGIAEADVLDIARFSPEAQSIHVDVGQSFLERIPRTLCVTIPA